MMIENKTTTLRLNRGAYLVPKPGSPTVTKEHPPRCESDALRALGLPWVTLDCEFYSLKRHAGA